MKNILTSFFIFALSLFLLPDSVMATGSFELNDFPESFNAVAGEKFQAYINFIYSGPEYRLGVSITGKKLPDDVKLGYIEYGGNGVNNILYSGIPKEAGDYSLNLVLTDNNGILLTKHFVFKVSGLVFSNDPLPNATVGKSYSQNLNFVYAGSNTPTLRLYDIPDNFEVSYLNINGQNGVFNFKLTPRKSGQFVFRGDALVNGIKIGSKTFSLMVNDPNQIPPPVVVNSVPILGSTEAVIAPIVPSPSVIPERIPKKIETPKPAIKKPEAVKDIEIKPTATSPVVDTSSVSNQESTTTSITSPVPVELIKESFFRRIWKKFIGWF